jgi:Lrp/AsnC family transcriptional regulator, leucine-responsive regulatory protein
VILGYRAVVSPEKIGFPLSAYLKVRVAQENVGKLIALARATPEVKEAHRSTARDLFLLRITALGESELHAVIAGFAELGETDSTIVDSTPVEKYTT